MSAIWISASPRAIRPNAVLGPGRRLPRRAARNASGMPRWAISSNSPSLMVIRPPNAASHSSIAGLGVEGQDGGAGGAGGNDVARIVARLDVPAIAELQAEVLVGQRNAVAHVVEHDLHDFARAQGFGARDLRLDARRFGGVLG